jgi:subtilase family serine protease
MFYLRPICQRFRASLVALFFLSVFAMGAANAQKRALITAAIDETKLSPVTGGLSARLKGASDLGVADVSQPSGRMLLMLKRSDEQEASLQSFLQQVHQQGSPQFHQWLTPSNFAQQFGANDSDVQQVTAWLQSHGMKVAGLVANRGAIEFSGSIGQVNEAFHTSIHKYNVQGETHVANATAAQIPSALAAAVAGVSQLNDFRPKPAIKLMGRAKYDVKTHTGVPQWTYGEGQGYAPLYFLTPEDFSTQYDVKPAYTAGVTGVGQTIGIINDSNIDISLVNAYRKLFGLAANPPEVVIDGTDPGINGDAVEAYLDVENAGAIAPAATVKLYIASTEGELGDGGLSFSLLRAVNDDAATVLSLSFSTCEEDGTAYNQYTNSLWEQAAAQGQTVFVSAGDSGSEGCYGLGVNGFASTPWDIAVGGTDAYFTDYASGGASISTFWSNTNDASLGSLQTKMTEQPWNGTQFGLNSTLYDPVVDQPEDTGSGGGGKSACAVGGDTFDPNTGLPICISGYPKPSWQVGTGVPNDGVRDLPDVSLFASNGYNGVIWPLCSEAGDCSETDPALNETFVGGVGGTSASAPAMAGIMALVNQKYGPQGQANYTMYALAAQYPAVFNDVKVGSNNEPCASYYVGFTFGCALDKNDSYYSYQEYPATTGYDLASGLGTVDVNQMLTNWNKVTYKTSATTLSVSPTALTHGQNATFTTTVTGTGTPTGAVSLVSSSTLPNNKGITAISLGTGGTGSEVVSYLPGGTYTIAGRYSGDGVNASSTSQPVTVTVNPESSTLAFTPQYFNANTFLPTTITANAQVPYGGQVLLDVQVEGAAGTQDGNPTGTVTFTDGTTSLGTVAVSAGGTAEFNGSFLTIGTHTISGTYSGDASYKGGTFGPITFSIVKMATYTDLFPDLGAIYNVTANAYQYQAGQSATLEAIILAQVSGGLTPTGTVSFQLGNATPLIATLVPGQDLELALASIASEVLSNLQVGTYMLTVTYSGDANFSGSTTSQAILVVPSTLINSTSAISVTSPSSLSNIPAGTVITLQGTVTGAGTKAPTGTVTFALGNFLTFQPVTITPATGDVSKVTFTFRAADLLPGNNTFSMNYSGDSVYAPSSSSTLIITDNNTDFTLQTTTPNLVIASGASGTGTFSLTPLNGFSGAVSISCAASVGLTCTPVATSVMVNGTTLTNTTVTINASSQLASNGVHHGADWRTAGGGVVLACMFVWLLPRRRRVGGMLLSLLAVGALLTGAGCSSTVSSSPPVQTSKNAAAGSYNVVVSGTSAAGTIHNATITVIVQ